MLLARRLYYAVLYFRKLPWEVNLMKAQAIGKKRYLRDLEIDVEPVEDDIESNLDDSTRNSSVPSTVPTASIPTHMPSKLPKVVIKYSQIGKARFGCPKMSEANVQAVRRFISGQMSNDDVRYIDQLRYIDHCVACVMTPLDHEIRHRNELTSEHMSYRRKAFPDVSSE